jgi:hypothetical protein
LSTGISTCIVAHDLEKFKRAVFIDAQPLNSAKVNSNASREQSSRYQTKRPDSAISISGININDSCISNIFIPSAPLSESHPVSTILKNIDVLIHVIHPSDLSSLDNINSLCDSPLSIIVVNQMDLVWNRLQQSTSSSDQFLSKYQLEKDDFVNNIVSAMGMKGMIL